MEVRRAKNSALVVFSAILAIHGFLIGTVTAMDNTIGEELDNFLFGPACKRASFVAMRKVCERVNPICPTSKGIAIAKTSYTWCKDFADTAAESAHITLRTTSANNGFCPFSLVIEEGKSVTIQCSGDIINKPLARNGPLARIEAHYLDGTYITLEKDMPITRSTTVILVSRFANAPDHEFTCRWTVA